MSVGNFNSTTTRRRKRSTGGEFYMEPGRTLRINLRTCTKAHKCSQVPVKPILIVRDSDTVAQTKEGELMLNLTRTDNPEKIVTIKALKAQKNNTMLVGGLLSEEEVNAQYDSAESSTFKSFIVDPVSTQDKTDRYLRNRIQEWYGTTVFISILPDQIVDGPFNITMAFNKSQAQNLAQDFTPRILRWCAAEDMWIDAGRTCDKLEDNRNIDWAKGLVSVKVCHSAAVCDTSGKKGKHKRAVPDNSGSGVGLYSIGSVDNTFSNSLPVITSDSNVVILEDEQFTFTIAADDPDGDDLYFVLNSTAPAPTGNVTLSLCGKLSYTPCVDCFIADTIHFTVWENRSDDETALSVDGQLVVNITGLNDPPNLQLFEEGHNIIPLSSVVTVNVEENNGRNLAHQGMGNVLAAYDSDSNDVVMLTFEPPKHGNLTMYTPVSDVDVIEQDCSQMWSTRQSLWDHVIDDFSHNVSLQHVSLPNPCGTHLVRRRLAWAVTLLKYTPSEGYIGEDAIKIVASDGQVQDLVTVNLYILRNPCMNNGICKGPETDPECTSTVRSTGFSGYQCQCPSGYLGVYCETDINECDSSPCPANYTCVNGDGHYECQCHTEWPCYVAPSTEEPTVEVPVEVPVALPIESALQAWHIAVITIAACLLLVIVAAAVFAVKKRAGRGKVEPLGEEVADTPPASLQPPSTPKVEVPQSKPCLLTARHVELTTYDQECSDAMSNMPVCE